MNGTLLRTTGRPVPLAGGELESLVADQHVVGVTTNPTIFASALAKGDRYTEQLRQLAAEGATVDEAVFTITTRWARASARSRSGSPKVRCTCRRPSSTTAWPGSSSS